MARKIEQLLRVMGDLHRFSKDNRIDSSFICEELSEEDLEFVSAAVQEPIDRGTIPHKDSDGIC